MDGVILATIGVTLVVTVAVHELGHAAAASLLGLPWRPTITRHGPAIIIGRADLNLTRRQVVLTAAGGPLANLALCAVAYQLGQGFVVLIGLELVILNLLPFPRSDGSRILRPGRAIARAASKGGSL